MLHSGSRNIGNRIGNYLIERAKRDIESAGVRLPDRDLAYLTERSESFEEYVDAVGWAQDYAKENRRLMLGAVSGALRGFFPDLEIDALALDCHHNYVGREEHFGERVWVTRKGAVRARADDLGIIPGSIGAKSFIVRGKGNAEAFHSCSHGAGRKMSRAAAHQRFTLEHHARDTAGVECRKDGDARRLHGHRRRDGGAERSRRDRLHAEAGRLRQGIIPRREPSGTTSSAGRSARAALKPGRSPSARKDCAPRP